MSSADPSEEAQRPARLPHIIEAPTGSELLLYDDETNQAFRLDASAADVWRRCDGQETVEQIAGNSDTVEEEILASLSAAGLVTGVPASGTKSNVTRRRFMMAGAAVVAGGVALPFLQSVAVPSAAAAASCSHHDNGVGNGGNDNGVPCETGNSDEIRDYGNH